MPKRPTLRHCIIHYIRNYTNYFRKIKHTPLNDLYVNTYFSRNPWKCHSNFKKNITGHMLNEYCWCSLTQQPFICEIVGQGGVGKSTDIMMRHKFKSAMVGMNFKYKANLFDDKHKMYSWIADHDHEYFTGFHSDEDDEGANVGMGALGDAEFVKKIAKRIRARCYWITIASPYLRDPMASFTFRPYHVIRDPLRPRNVEYVFSAVYKNNPMNKQDKMLLGYTVMPTDREELQKYFSFKDRIVATEHIADQISAFKQEIEVVAQSLLKDGKFAEMTRDVKIMYILKKFKTRIHSLSDSKMVISMYNYLLENETNEFEVEAE